MEFYPVNAPGCLGMAGTARIGNVQIDSLGNINIICQGGATIFSAFPINPALGKYWPPSLVALADNFTRFEMKVQPFFIPGCNSSTVGKIAMCYIEDPGSVYLQFGVTSNTSAVTISQIAESATIQEWPSQSRWKGPWYKRPAKDDMTYINGAIIAATGNVLWNNSAISLRSQIQGALIFTQNNGTVSTNLGDLFMNYNVKLCYLNVPSTSSTFSTTAAREIYSQQERDKDLLLSNATKILSILKIEHSSTDLEDEEKLRILKHTWVDEKGSLAPPPSTQTPLKSFDDVTLRLDMVNADKQRLIATLSDTTAKVDELRSLSPQLMNRTDRQT
jgi:hypothetical protein